MYKCFVCRYHEIATKGHNRSMFENKLINNIRTLAEYDGIQDITLQRIRGRIFLRKLKNAEFSETEQEQIPVSPVLMSHSTLTMYHSLLRP